MIIASKFRPAWWLTNNHCQTIVSALLRFEKAPISFKERIELPDNDFIDLIWANKGLPPNSPLVILLHGLGGNMQSSYVAGLMNVFNRQGWRVVLMHFRGAGEEPNRLLRAYHAGDTEDLEYLMQMLQQREPNTVKAAVGISMGGNVLLKWLGEKKKGTFLSAAVAVSVPFDLRLVANRVCQGLSRVYQHYLLRRLKHIFVQKEAAYQKNRPDLLQKMKDCKCFWTFDEYVTAPLCGFSHVYEYYRLASSRYYLKDINTPTLLIHSLDDPFMTKEVLPKAEELSDAVCLELSAKGGHVGFIAGNIPGKPQYWLEERIPSFLAPFLGQKKTSVSKLKKPAGFRQRPLSAKGLSSNRHLKNTPL